MTMLTCPGHDLQQIITCTVCQASIPLAQASVGQLTPAGVQTFFCATHIHISQQRQLLRAWASLDVAPHMGHSYQAAQAVALAGAAR